MLISQIPGNLSIRLYQRGDLLELQRIRERAFAPIFASFRALLGIDISTVALANTEAEQAPLLDELCKPDSSRRIFVAEQSQRTIGFAAVMLNHAQGIGEIGLNAVDPDWAGKGVGTALYRHSLSFMREQGMRLAFVNAGADLSHAAALQAYQKAGFKAMIPSRALYQEL